MTEESAASGRTVISKAAAILMTFLDDGYVHTLTEIAAATGLPLSTAHRLARELVAWRILDRTEDGDYRVGLPLRLIGAVGGAGSTIEERAPLILQDLSYATGAEVRLGVLRDRAVAYIEKLPGRRPVSAFSNGAVLPAHATAMGKALLAFSPPEYVEMVLKRGLTSYTRYTLTAPDRFRRALAMTRLSRLAVSRWELRLDHSGMAVPVFGPGGLVAAALEVRVEDPAAELPTIRPVLIIAGRSLTRELSAAQGMRPREPGVHRVRLPGGNVRSLRPMDEAVRGSGRS
ncbi:IclR family transcriptional regulator [Pseudonocardia sp. H11422]|uniref:IclR family transcriptional regulator n=1 Tax=Pseudonocardia sp. H11422 TaxID=2835866 RepID=UPI001BDCF02F|nr:IclR family transcriptional regulator [Pseudonocardia sp. H11422]